MIRPLIIFFNLIVAIFVKVLTGTPTAEVKAPSSVNAGEPFTIEVTIQTNGETDFVRYSMELPEGWTAEKMEAAGSSFRFENKQVKFLWSRVGEVKELKISYKVTPPSSASGDIELPCKISHTVNNLPENIPLPPVKVNVKANSSASSNEENTHQPDTTAKPPVLVNVERNVPSDEVSGTFTVRVTIFKDDLTSFGKFEDSIPFGCTAQLVEADGADFKFEHGKARFTWWNLPQKSTLNVSYTVNVLSGTKGNLMIDGIFSYVENSFGKVYKVPVATVKLKEEQVVVSNDQNQQQQNNQGNSDQNNGKTNNDQSSNSQQQQSQSSSNASVKYSVQIAAMQRNVPISYYSSTYSISENISLEQHSGLHKYTVGNFSSYKDARDHRETVRNKGIVGPFVTAYNGGTRITVQEALMITSQKWIP